MTRYDMNPGTHRRGRRRRGLALMLGAAMAVVSCGPSGSDGSSTTGDDGGTTDSASTTAFCDEWDDAMKTLDDERFTTLLDHPPPGLEGAAAEVRRSGMSADTPGAQAAMREIFAWVELNCRRVASGPGVEPAARRLAPPAGTPGLLPLCSAGSSLPAGGGQGHMVLFGELARDDPYDGPMLGVLWNPETEGAIGSDGTKTPVRVRGTDGIAAPITVFQQAVIEELGTVIAWREGGLAVGLYGRFWDQGRTDDLVAIANSLELVDGAFRLPPSAVPDGYRQIYEGDPDVMNLVIPLQAGYHVRYQNGGAEPAILDLTGFVASPAEFEAFRFLTLDMERTTTGGNVTIAGNAWGPEGPAVVTWQEPDGLVVRLVGIGVDLDTVRAAADATRELTPSEWGDLVTRNPECTEIRPSAPAPPDSPPQPMRSAAR